jgi:hypothetical protein
LVTNRYNVSIAVHRSLTSLVSWDAVSENEIKLTYAIPSHPKSSQSSCDITITLLFLPNTRRLAAARVDGLGPNVDISEIVDYHVQSDDVRGLIAASVSAARDAMATGRW